LEYPHPESQRHHTPDGLMDGFGWMDVDGAYGWLGMSMNEWSQAKPS